jgi:DNA-binding protein H-NS
MRRKVFSITSRSYFIMASSANANTSANANVNIVDVDMSSDIEDSVPTEKELELLRQMEAEKQRRLEEAKKKKKEEKRRAAEEAKRIAEEEAARKAAEEEANRKAAEEEAKRKAEEAARAAASPELWEGMGKTPAEGAEQPTAPKRVCFRCTKDGEVCEWTEVSIAFWTGDIFFLAELFAGVQKLRLL